ncbi:YfhO family protein [Ectobacillus polymachus]|uniref:YfhO family protein n=1 Tax=Ectobacillus polymachus TaxID=1508806 RepID=UPI003A845A46
MQHLLQLFKKNKYVLYGSAFLLPFAIYGILFMLLGIAPFGPKSILVTDMHTQYVQFYTYLYDVMRNGKSIFYSWEAGMGLNFFGVFAYYLASPFSLLILLFDRSHIPEALLLITLLKVGLAGVTMAYFLSKVTKYRDLPIIFFSTFYALMSFVTVYSFCVMWLDGIYLLPLILLGVENLVQKNKFLLLTCSLALMFISNFYIAYMVGVFTFLYFVARFAIVHDIRNVKFGLKKLGIFMLITALAVGISAIVTLPTYLDLKSNFAERAALPWTMEFNFDLLTVYGRFFSGVIDTTVNGLPNLYCGVLTILLVPLFFITKKITRKEKIVYGILVLILLISMEIPLLNIAWHGFEPPTNFPYRYSFLFSFLLIYMAFRVYLIFDKELLPVLRKVVIFNIFMILFISKVAHYYMPSNKILINVGLILAYTLLLYWKAIRADKKTIVSYLLVAVVSLDVGFSTLYSIKLMGLEYGYIPRDTYAVVHPNYAETFDSIAKKDTGFYRVETTEESTWNDAMRFDYKGITHFNSVANGHLNLYMQDLGYGFLDALILQNGKGIVTTDSLFGVKYMVSDIPLDKYGFEQINQVGNNRVYENKNALPLGYMMNGTKFDTVGKDKLKIQKVDYNNAFESQNQLIGPLDVTGTENYFKPLSPLKEEYINLDVLPASSTKTVAANGTTSTNTTTASAATNTDTMLPKDTKQLYLAKQQQYKPASIKYEYDVKGQQQLYMQLRTDPTDFTKIYVNGKSLGEKFTQYPQYYWNNGVLDLGLFKDEKVEVEIQVDRSAIDVNQNLVYGLDVNSFQNRIDQLKSQSLQVTSYDSRSVAGTINVKQPGTMFLSIPYDKGWSVMVDGQKTKPLKLNDAFLGVNLPQGQHNIQLKYTSPGFTVGAIISLFSVILTAGAGWWMKRKRL